MRSVTTFQLFLFLLGLSSPVLSGKSQKPPGKNAILLSQVHALTLHGGRLTSSRRVSPVPQLKCVGPSKRICDLYEIDTMRCTNAGYGYDEDDVQWTCTASLPPELKLGSTDVICEGYRNSDDPWVLKGSCGVEYRMLLTDLGEEKFGYNSYDFAQRGHRPGKLGRTMDRVFNVLFTGIFIGVFLWIFWACIRGCFRSVGNRRGPQPGRRWGGGGGGDGGGGPYPGPPPPPPPPPYRRYSYDPSTENPDWRPGFWTGVLTGGSVGYGLGSRNSRYSSPARGRRGNYGSGEGSSSRVSSSTTTSTGFGSTSRR